MKHPDQQAIRDRIHAVIPGGAHTYSRGDDQFPANAPAVLERGEGCYAWGSDGKKYLDYGMGLRSGTIGYAQPEIDDAALAEMRKGNNLTKASMTELLAAEKLLSLFPGMDMVKFATNGSTVVTAAVKLARAYTGRPVVARCAEHPFFSYDDWFIGDTVVKRGVPEKTQQLTVQFNFNDIASVERLFAAHPDTISCVVLEPTTHVEPAPGFLAAVERIAKAHGALVICDEISCSFRVDYAAYVRYGFHPDMVTVGKGLANTYPVAALLGKRDIMELGGIRHSGERVFLTSTTFGATMSGLGAMMATIDYFKKHDVLEHLWRYNWQLLEGANALAKELGVDHAFYFEGFEGRLNYVTKDAEGKPSLAFRTLFAQEMATHGVLIPWIAPSFAHKDRELQITIDAMRHALTVYKKALHEGVEHYLRGPAIRPVFRRHN